MLGGESEREALCQNFIMAEVQYTSEIKLIVTEYAEPLRQSMEEFGLYEEILQRIFGPITVLVDFHGTFCNLLKIGSSSAVTVFSKMIHVTRIYQDYIQKHEGVITTLASLRNNEKFTRFLGIKENLPKLRKKILPGFLMLPFERVAEYLEFFNSLQGITPENHQEFDLVAECLTAIENLNSFMRRFQSSYENMTVLLRIQMRILGDFESFVEAGRYWVHEGEVKFEKNHRKQAEQFNLFLFNDMLLWTSLKGSYQDSCEFLDTTFEFGSDANIENRFWFGLHNQKQEVACSSKKSRDSWVHMISRYRTRVLKEKGRSGAPVQRRRTERTGSYASSRSSVASRTSRTSKTSLASSTARERRGNRTKNYTRSHRSSMASSGYGFDRGNREFGSVQSFDVTSQRSGYSGASAQHHTRRRRRRRTNPRKDSAAAPSVTSQSTFQGARGLGNNVENSEYADSDASYDDSITLKASSDFNSKQLQKVYQRLNKAQARIIKLQEAQEAQKKLVRDLQESNTELRKHNKQLRKDRKELESEIKKLKRRQKDKGPPITRKSKKKNQRRNSFHKLLENLTPQSPPQSPIQVQGIMSYEPAYHQGMVIEETNPQMMYVDASGSFISEQPQVYQVNQDPVLLQQQQQVVYNTQTYQNHY